MSLQEHTTTTPEVLEALRKAAQLIVAGASYELLVGIVGGGQVFSPKEPKKKVSQPKNGGDSADNIIDKYLPAFNLAAEIVRKAGHLTLAELIKRMDVRSITPFKGSDPLKSSYWLARYFQRNHRRGMRLNPLVKPSRATPDTEIWTKEAWAAHHKLDESESE